VAGNPAYFGLFSLANNSTIILAPSADGGLWNATTDATFVDEILKAVEADLCVDTTRIMLEGFSQGAAMSWTLACARPNVFRAVVGHSGGGMANPTTCQPVAYFGSLGLQENGGQTTQTDQFAKWNECTIETLPKAPTGATSARTTRAAQRGIRSALVRTTAVIPLMLSADWF
jgi:dienelactone hydrolase